MESFIPDTQNDSKLYKNFIEDIEFKEAKYRNFKKTLNENEEKLANKIECELNDINESRVNLYKLKYQDDINLKISSIKLVMEKINAASNQLLNEEFAEKVDRMKNELETSKVYEIEKVKHEYELKIEMLGQQIESYKNEIENQKNSFKSDFDLALRSIESNWSQRLNQILVEKAALSNTNKNNYIHNEDLISFDDSKFFPSTSAITPPNINKANLISRQQLSIEIENNKRIDEDNDDDEDINESDINKLKKKIRDKNILLSSLRQSERIHLIEINELKQRISRGNNETNDTTTNTSINNSNENSFVIKEQKLLSPASSSHVESPASYDYLNNSSSNNMDYCYSSSDEQQVNKIQISSESSQVGVEGGRNNIRMTMMILHEQNDERNANMNGINYKEEYYKLKQEIESMTHPSYRDLQNELQQQFYQEYDDLKRNYENKLKLELKAYENLQEQKLKTLVMENKKRLSECEMKQKLEMERLKEEFEQVLNDDLNELRKELEKARSINQGIDIKFRYVAEHRQSSLTNSSDNEQNSCLMNKMDNNSNLRNQDQQPSLATTSKKVSIYAIEQEKLVSENNVDVNDDADTSIIEQIPISIETSHLNNISSTTLIEAEAACSFNSRPALRRKMISTENYVLQQNELQLAIPISNEIQIEFEPDHNENNYQTNNFDEKLHELEQKNKSLKNTLESIYEKDDVFMASLRRENEEKENTNKLLQLDLQQLLNERNSLQLNNQNLLNIISKSLLMSTSIDDHINRRLARIVQSQSFLTPYFNTSTTANQLQVQKAQFNKSGRKSRRLLSSKNSNGTDSAGSSDINEADSNEDLSDEGLDISHRLCDNPINFECSSNSDETIIDANLKLQSSIDKILSMFEETSKQLSESSTIQMKLADKLEESQKTIGDYKIKYQNLEMDCQERINEMQKRLNNFEGLAEAYENEIQSKKYKINQLENELSAVNQMLKDARSEIEIEKYELSNLETVRKDLEAQRSFFTKDLQDNDIKELINNNTLLLDEKHELEYKLNRTNELSQQQINDLEQSVENFNEQLRRVKHDYEDQIYDLKKQIDCMDVQIKSDKAFIDAQLNEREQERDEYEAKIYELKELLNRKSNLHLDEEDAIFKKLRESEQILIDKTDRLNQLSLQNQELERTLNENLKLNNENENKIEQLKEEIDTLIKLNKTQTDQLNALKERLNDAEKRLENEMKNSEVWLVYKEDLQQQKDNLQAELYSCMSKYSELQTHTENLEMNLTSQIKNDQEKFKSNALMLADKEAQINALKKQIDEMNVEFQNRIDVEINHLKFLQEKNDDELIKSFEIKINELKDELVKKKDDLEEMSDKYKVECEKVAMNEITHQLIEEKNDEIDDLHDRIKQLEGAVNERLVDSESLKEEISRLNEDKSQLAYKLNDQVEANKKLTEEVADSINDNEFLKVNIAEKEETIGTLNQEIEELNLKLKKSLKETENYKQELEMLSLDKEDLEKNELGLKESLNQLTHSKTKLEDEISELLKEIDSKQTEIDQLTEKLNERDIEYEELKATMVNMKDKYLNSEKDFNDKLVKLNEQLELANEAQNQYKENSQKQIEDLELVIKQLVKEKEEKILANSHLINELNTQLEELHIENKKSKELVAELNEKFKAEIEKMKDLIQVEYVNDVNKLKMESKSELDVLRHEYENRLIEQAEEIRREVQEVYENQIKELKEKYEKEIAELIQQQNQQDDELKSSSVVISSADDTIDNNVEKNLGQRLKDQVKLTKELDNDLLKKMNENLSRGDNEQDDDGDEFNESTIPDKIKDILDKLDNEGVLILSLSELIQLKAYLIQKNDRIDSKNNLHARQLNKALSDSAFDNEKNKLMQEVVSLKEALSRIEVNDVANMQEWRADLIKAIANIFQSEKDSLLAELRSFVTMTGFLDTNSKLNMLEAKLDTKHHAHQKSLDYLTSIDRQSLINEVKSTREELKKFMSDMSMHQEAERELKRELKLMEYAKDAEAIKGNDLKQSLNIEKTKSLELLEKLNQEKKKTNLLQEQLRELNEQVVNAKDHLNAEIRKYARLTKELEIERNKNELYRKNKILEEQFIELEKVTNNLDNLLIQERSKNEKLSKAYTDLKNHHILNQKSATEINNSNNMNLERLRQSLEFLAIKHKNELESSNVKHQSFTNDLKKSLVEIIRELEKISSLSDTSSTTSLASTNSLNSKIASTALETKLIEQNRELISAIKKLSDEKSDCKSLINKLEEELWHLKRNNSSTIKSETNNASMSDHDREKFKKLYFKYLRAESFRKSLVYQKKFLLIMLSGYEETEREILATLKIESSSIMNNKNMSIKHQSNGYDSNAILSSNNGNSLLLMNNNSKNAKKSLYSNRFLLNRPKSRFRTVVICIIAVRRIKFLQKKHSNMLTRMDNLRTLN